ncbi:MAG: thioredoxin domain-containing protein [Candidatus Jacksonbacteria bacterium]
MSDQQNASQPKTSPKLMFVLGLVSAVAIVSLGLVVLFALGKIKTGEIAGDQEPTQEQEPPAEIILKDITKQDHIRGNIDAPVKIVEYSDLLCPYCQMHHATMKQLKEDYGDKIAWVYRHFPLPSLHPTAPKMAEGTECAAELGGNDGFWALADKISEGSVSLETLADAAGAIGLDKDKFQECLDSGKYADKIQAAAQDSIITAQSVDPRVGTPLNIILGPDDQKTPLAGAYPIEAFKEVIDATLAQ